MPTQNNGVGVLHMSAYYMYAHLACKLYMLGANMYDQLVI